LPAVGGAVIGFARGFAQASDQGRELRTEGEEDRGHEEQPGNQVREGSVRRGEQQQATGDATEEGNQGQQRQRRAKAQQFGTKSPRGGEAAWPEGNRVAGVGHHGRDAGGEQRRKRQEGAATGNRVHRPGAESGDGEQSVGGNQAGVHKGGQVR
jgi:hypothetical protein